MMIELTRKNRTKQAALCALMLACASCTAEDPTTIRIGSKNFTEQVVLGEIIAQHLENRLAAPIVRNLNLGGTLLAHQALTSGSIDLYPEYTGTAIAVILKEVVLREPGVSGAAEVLARVQEEYQRQFGIAWLPPIGIDNGFAMVIRGDQARARNLTTLADAGRQAGWNLGVGYEFEQRSDGLAALRETYNLQLAGPPQTMDLGLLYRALEQGQVDMIAANATDGLLSSMDLAVLEDNLHAFPPYELSIAVRGDTLDRVPGLKEALTELSGKFDNQIMQQLNYRVDGEHEPVADVAADFLRQAGLN